MCGALCQAAESWIVCHASDRYLSIHRHHACEHVAVCVPHPPVVSSCSLASLEEHAVPPVAVPIAHCCIRTRERKCKYQTYGIIVWPW